MLVSFALGEANFSCFYPTRNLKVAFYPTPTPDATQWNTGGVGPSGVWAGVGHVHFIFFVQFLFALGPVFQWNMGFIISVDFPQRSSTGCRILQNWAVRFYEN